MDINMNIIKEKKWLTPTEAKHYCKELGSISQRLFYKDLRQTRGKNGQYLRSNLDQYIIEHEMDVKNKFNEC